MKLYVRTGTRIAKAKRVWHVYLEASQFFDFCGPSHPFESRGKERRVLVEEFHFERINLITRYAVHLRARAVSTHEQTLSFFFVLLPASLPLSCQSHTSSHHQHITHVTPHTQPGLCYALQQMRMLMQEMDASLQERVALQFEFTKKGLRLEITALARKLTAGPDRVGSSNSESRAWTAPDGRRGEDGDDDVSEEERAGRRPQRAEAVSPGSLGLRSRGIRSKINQSRRSSPGDNAKVKEPLSPPLSVSQPPRSAQGTCRSLATGRPRAMGEGGGGYRRPSGASAFWASVLPLSRPHRRPRAMIEPRRTHTHKRSILRSSKVERDIFFGAVELRIRFW